MHHAVCPPPQTRYRTVLTLPKFPRAARYCFTLSFLHRMTAFLLHLPSSPRSWAFSSPLLRTAQVSVPAPGCEPRSTSSKVHVPNDSFPRFIYRVPTVHVVCIWILCLPQALLTQVFLGVNIISWEVASLWSLHPVIWNSSRAAGPRERWATRKALLTGRGALWPWVEGRLWRTAEEQWPAVADFCLEAFFSPSPGN